MVDSDADAQDGDAQDDEQAAGPTREDPAQATENGITASYYEAEGERILAFEADGKTAAIAQNVEGYAILKVRPSPDGDELERYYGFDMALDHAAELLGVAVHDLPVPEPATDMGM
ncbi:MAG: hypothetical protein ABEH81_10385 [Halopenitus sp.]